MIKVFIDGADIVIIKNNIEVLKFSVNAPDYEIEAALEELYQIGYSDGERDDQWSQEIAS